MIFYASSFDHYGPAIGLAYTVHAATSGWDMDNDSMLGDGFTNFPTFTAINQATSTIRTTAQGTLDLKAPSWGARRGDYALVADGQTINLFAGISAAAQFTRPPTASTRIAIPGASDTVRSFHIAFGMDTLPTVDKAHGTICDFLDGSGNIRATLGVNPSGRLILVDGTPMMANFNDIQTEPTLLAATAAPVISANTWYSLNIRVTTNGADANADVEIWVGDITPANKVMDVSGVAFTDTSPGQPAGVANNVDVLGLLPATLSPTNGSLVIDTNERAVRDLVFHDATGSYNTTPLGQVFVAAQQMRAEDNEGSNWQVFPRENIGTGIIDFRTQDGLYVADNAALELGSGDFTLEGWFKLDSINTNPSETVLVSKWDEANDQRSWKLEYDDTDGRFKFIVSTDGVAETVLFTYPFTPVLQKYYHLAVCRDSAVTRVFVDGVQIGMDQADANTYFDGTAVLGVMGRYDGTTISAATAADGWADEIRLTVGVARYTSNFAVPTAPFGRNGVDDANFASVELLIGGDGSITDESSNAFTVNAGAGTVSQEPDDSTTSYEVLNQRPAWDDSFIEAINTFAENILQLDATPADGETVVLGAQTYTYRTVLTPTAYEVLIGADAGEAINNLVQAVNGGTGSGTLYAAGTVANPAVLATLLPDTQALFQATAIGTAGNSVASTETLANGAFLSGATFAGGVDIPSPSDFAIERLPIDVTGVLAMQVTARGYKSDAGSANLRFDLKGPAATVDQGTAQATDLNPSWLRQIFEEDPDTSATITPSTITGGRVRVTRTT